MKDDEIAHITSCIAEVKRVFAEDEEVSGRLLADLLTDLGQVLTYRQEDALDQLAVNPNLKKDIPYIIARTPNEKTNTKGASWFNLYLRVYRGIILLARNLVVHHFRIDLDEVSSSFDKYIANVKSDIPVISKTIAAYLQLFANASQTLGESAKCIKFRNSVISNSTTRNIIRSDIDARLALFVLIRNTIDKEDTLDYDSVEFLVLEGAKVDFSTDLSGSDTILLLTLGDCITHERFLTWIHQHVERKANLPNLFRLLQVVITSREDWSSHDIICLLSWLYHYFEIVSDDCRRLLTSPDVEKDDLKTAHSSMMSVLDSLTHLGKFETCQKYLRSYKGIENIIQLLRTVHENTERQTLKNKEHNIRNKSLKSFPEAKSLLIELLSYLVYESFESQEKVREHHGLELVLSNCVIDKNEPYIKERAIICIRFLLEKNAENQKFVAQLEAKKTYDEEALREVGYETEIIDGKLKLKKVDNT